MPPFHFRLGKIQQVRQSVREHRRLELLEAQQAEDQVAAQIAQLQAELQVLHGQARSAGGPGRLSVDELRQIQRYEHWVRNELESAQNRRLSIAAEIERRQQALVAADQEVKALDRLQEKQRVQYRIDQVRREAKADDEQAAIRRPSLKTGEFARPGKPRTGHEPPC